MDEHSVVHNYEPNVDPLKMLYTYSKQYLYIWPKKQKKAVKSVQKTPYEKNMNKNTVQIFSFINLLESIYLL